MRSGAVVEREVGQDFVDFYTITVAPGSGPLVLTTAWDDVRGTANVIPSLINDLDLKVYSPTGVRLPQGMLSPSSPSTAAVRTAEDHLNKMNRSVSMRPRLACGSLKSTARISRKAPSPTSASSRPTLHSPTPDR